MTFREKSAWIMAASLIAGAIGYFWVVGAMSAALGAVAPPLWPLAALYVVALVVFAVVGHTAAAIAAPKEANARADERDKEIGARASQWGGVLLSVGVVLSLGAYMAGFGGDFLFHAVLASLMAAQIAEYAAQIWLYRTRV